MVKRAKAEPQALPSNRNRPAPLSLSEKLAARLKEIRESKTKAGYPGVRKWSKQDVASRAGMSLTQYDLIERGLCDPRLSSLEAIAKAHELKLSELFR